MIRVVPSQLECLAVLEVRNSVFVPPYDKFRSGILGDRGFLGNGGVVVLSVGFGIEGLRTL